MSTVPTTPAIQSAASTVLAPAKENEYNRTGLNYRQPMPRPKVRGLVIDAHTHLFAARHAKTWFQGCDHFGIDACVTMAPLEEAVVLQRRNWGHRLQFIAIPAWGDTSPSWHDNWLTRMEAFHNMGSRIIKFHAAPGTLAMRGIRMDDPRLRKIMDEAVRDMILMSHVGDPDTWFNTKYAADKAKYATRDEYYKVWESLLTAYKHRPWLAAHLAGNPEDLSRLQYLFDTYPNLYMDCSATRWMVREISLRRDAAREFFIRNQDRILWGSDQVSGNDRGFDFLASRWWAHRKLWETAYVGPTPIFDPDLPPDNQPVLRGLALPDVVLQKIYHDNTVNLLARVGVHFELLDAAA